MNNTMETSSPIEIHPSIINIGTVSYLLGAGLQTTIKLESNENLEPVTIISTSDDESITSSWVSTKYEEFSKKDDVWCDAFTRYVFAQKKSGVLSLVASSSNFISQDNETKNFGYRGNTLPTGPYVLTGSTIYPVFKLYPDPLNAFVCGIIPTFPGSQRYQRTLINQIPVPSRLSSPSPSPNLPLSGKRIAMKDIFNLTGTITTLCSNAYTSLQSPSTTTSPCIQKLINQGAIIIGKVKTTPFTSGMGPRDWVDYQAPFNPRGCGYLDADCSSAGSGAAMAGYEWLDFSIGSDSLGSMVGPAAASGLFGIRPTHGRISCEGIVPVSAHLDTPGIFSRDISEFSIATRSWLGPSNPQPTLTMPTKLTILPERFSNYVPGIQKVMENFIQDFEAAIQLPRTTIDIEELWKSHGPGSSFGKTFVDYFKNTLAHIQLYDHHKNSSSFRTEYQQKFNKQPYIEPLLLYKWNLGSKLTSTQFQTAVSQKQAFTQFINEYIFKNNGIMLLPFGQPDTFYRDEYSGSIEEWGTMWQGFGVPLTAFSSLGGGPAISIPVGQRIYHSRVTETKEYQPVGMMLLGAPGTDEYLIELVEHVLKLSGRALSVKTGSVAF